MKKLKSTIKNGVCKVPIVMQLEALECGAACLTMIMAYYGKWIPLEEVRRDCGVSRNGLKASNILRAARDYGFEARGFRCGESGELKAHCEFPCIIHWNFNHFVVLNGFKGDNAVINDPAKGTIKIPMKEFDQSFTGVYLTFKPAENFKPEGTRKSTLSFAKKRLKGAFPIVAFTALASVIVSVFGAINPMMTKFFMDKILSGGNSQWLLPFLTILGILGVLQVSSILIRSLTSLEINGKLAVTGNASYMWKVLRLPMDFFSQRMAGEIQMRQNANASVSETLVETFAPLVMNAAMMIFYLSVMLKYSVILSVVGLLSIVLNSFLARIISEKRVNSARVQTMNAGKFYSTTISGIKMIETIKANGAENGFFQKWAGYQASMNTSSEELVKVNAGLARIPEFVILLSNSVIIAIGVMLSINGNFTLGMLMTFQGIMTNFITPAMTLIEAGQILQEMRTNMERIEDVMEYPADPNAEEKENADENTEYNKLSGNIELKNVTFGYSKTDEPLIKDFSMKLKQGSSVAFAGSTGCGKSTLSKLISGLYEAWSGEILFDGKKISEIDRNIFKGSVAVVDQDITLFEDTISANIKMWDNTIEDFEMILAARDAQIHNDIMERSEGYQYKLSDGGADLSGGQRQRMEIARVLAQDPTIIILDEATSALDAKTEFEVIKAIKNRGITSIIVAHRLSTIRDCEEIIVIDKGRAVERGTHEELMAKNGFYRRLIENE